MNSVHGFTKVSGAESREHQSDILAKRITDVGTDIQLRVDYDGSNNPIYIGHGAKGLGADETGWLINKLTWSSGNMTLMQSVVGVWDDRTGLTYT